MNCCGTRSEMLALVLASLGLMIPAAMGKGIHKGLGGGQNQLKLKIVHELPTKLNKIKHNRLNVGRIALEQLMGALINCSLLQSGGGREGSLNGTKKFNIGLQIPTLEVNIYHF